MFGALKATLGAGAMRFVIYGLLAALAVSTAAAGYHYMGKQGAQITTLIEKQKAETYKDSFDKEQAAFKEYRDAKAASEKALKTNLKRQAKRERKLKSDIAELEKILEEADEEYEDFKHCLDVKRPPNVLRMLNFDANESGGGSSSK